MTRGQRLGGIAGLVIALMTLYHVVGRIPVGEPQAVVTPIDESIQLDTRWIFVYSLMYAQVLSPASALDDHRVFKRWVLALALIYAVAVPIWLLFPVQVPRPEGGGLGFTAWAAGLIWTLDPPTNCLPSMHVAVAASAALVVRRVDRAVGALLLLHVPLIWYSTMAMRQHWAVDGAVGLALAVAADWLVFDLKPLPPEAFVRLERRWHGAWLGIWVLAVLGFGAWYTLDSGLR